MKKLALALVCFASLAFFASCVKEGQPTIQILNEEGYVQDGQTVDLYEEVQYGFVVASSPESNKELKQLSVKIDDGEETIVDLTGQTTYTFRNVIAYEPSRDIIGESIIQAVVTDVAGQTATATITLSINEPAQPLIGTAIEWVRRGANVLDAEEMAEYGLQWTGTYKAPFATLKPIDGATMYLCDGNDFADITTVGEKAAYFDKLAETARPVDSYRNIDANQSANYNDILAVINGENTYLIHITRAEIETGTYGTQITIKGEAK